MLLSVCKNKGSKSIIMFLLPDCFHFQCLVKQNLYPPCWQSFLIKLYFFLHQPFQLACMFTHGLIVQKKPNLKYLHTTIQVVLHHKSLNSFYRLKHDADEHIIYIIYTNSYIRSLFQYFITSINFIPFGVCNSFLSVVNLHQKNNVTNIVFHFIMSLTARCTKK